MLKVFGLKVEGSGTVVDEHQAAHKNTSGFFHFKHNGVAVWGLC
jgi:hypothetical protein